MDMISRENGTAVFNEKAHSRAGGGRLTEMKKVFQVQFGSE